MKEFIDKLIERLEEKKDNCEHNQKVFENKRSLRLATICEAKAEVYKDAIAIVNELAEEYKVSEMPTGWISVSERLPSERDWYLAVFQENDSDFILVPRVADYIGEHTPFTTEEGWLIIDLEDDMNSYYKKLKCLAWCELPAPYTEGEAELYRAKSVDGEYQEYKGDWK